MATMDITSCSKLDRVRGSLYLSFDTLIVAFLGEYCSEETHMWRLKNNGRPSVHFLSACAASVKALRRFALRIAPTTTPPPFLLRHHHHGD